MNGKRPEQYKQMAQHVRPRHGVKYKQPGQVIERTTSRLYITNVNTMAEIYRGDNTCNIKMQLAQRTTIALINVLLSIHPSSRNCIYQNLTFLKDLKKNITMSPFCIPKVLKSATKISKIGEQIKILCQEIILNRAFHCKLSARKVTISPPPPPKKKKKSKLVTFHLKGTKPKQNCIVCKPVRQTLIFSPKDLLDLQFQGAWITSLAHANAYSK